MGEKIGIRRTTNCRSICKSNKTSPQLLVDTDGKMVGESAAMLWDSDLVNHKEFVKAD
jgi:hypothetical protein